MGRVLTLLYHRVKTYVKDIQSLSVTPKHFEEQMEWLKSNYEIVGFGDDWNKLKGDAICITFDDGYRDNFLTAVPILNKLQIPVAIFVATENVDTEGEMWWDELERNLLIDKKYCPNFHLADALFECTWDTSTHMQREDLYFTLHWLIKQISVEKRKDWIRQLQEWNNYQIYGRRENKCVQIEDLQCIDLSQILIGAHTVNHPVLSKMSLEEQKEEIGRSKQYLEKVLKRPVLTFSYPFGAELDYNEETIKACRELGFIKVAANIPGIWSSGTDPYQIPRYIVRDWNLDQFKEHVTMFWKGN